MPDTTINNCIDKHIKIGIVDVASIKYFIETGKISDTFRKALQNLSNEVLITQKCPHPFKFVAQCAGESVCFKCGEKIS